MFQNKYPDFLIVFITWSVILIVIYEPIIREVLHSGSN